MAEKESANKQKVPSHLQNWISFLGIILAAGSFFAVIFLLAIDFFRGFENPYMGILTYLVAPVFLISGLILIAVGVVLERKRRRRMAPGEIARFPRIDLNIRRHRNNVLSVAVVTFTFLILTSLGTYRTYHFTESVQFCGQTCHSVMKPEFVAFQNSPHARITCTHCHIGPGANWFVRSKLSGTYQVYATLANKYPRPIPTPVKNLRPAQETCEQCHWPRKFFGSTERVNQHYLANEENTPWTIRLLMKVGGGDPTLGPVGGIHWHMNISNKVEYIARDEERQVIPWVRVTSPDGKAKIYQSTEEPLKPEEIRAAAPRVMDCVDCHNRPSHIYYPPSNAVNIAMSTGRISSKLPYVKLRAVEALTGEYQSSAEALKNIEEKFAADYKDYTDQAQVKKAVAEVKNIYSKNFFPEMKVDWRVYPNNIGHSIFPGCYRCHDGLHAAEDGTTISRDCNSCHTIIAQGSTDQVQTISSQGLRFEHPVDIADAWEEINCAECHTGALTE